MAVHVDNYAAPEGWYGSYYELAIQLSAEPDDALLRAAMDALWSAPGVVGGPWLDRGARDRVTAPPLVEPEGMSSTYGILAVPPLGSIRCVSWVLRETGRGADWIDLSIPTAGLDPFGLTYPVHESPPQLLEAIDRAFLAIAAHLYTRAPFLLGLVGEEVSGAWSADSIRAEAVSYGGLLLPEALVRSLGASGVAEGVVADLFWIPRRDALADGIDPLRR